mmetsp:Transcript_23358/g.21246  ORF Transcript_23358/g.21246 Transcript_23358/m.21246 type:complete len:343 (+) Transcript_23358:47-1075(+)
MSLTNMLNEHSNISNKSEHDVIIEGRTDKNSDYPVNNCDVPVEITIKDLEATNQDDYNVVKSFNDICNENSSDKDIDCRLPDDVENKKDDGSDLSNSFLLDSHMHDCNAEFRSITTEKSEKKQENLELFYPFDCSALDIENEVTNSVTEETGLITDDHDTDSVSTLNNNVQLIGLLTGKNRKICIKKMEKIHRKIPLNTVSVSYITAACNDEENNCYFACKSNNHYQCIAICKFTCYNNSTIKIYVDLILSIEGHGKIMFDLIESVGYSSYLSKKLKLSNLFNLKKVIVELDSVPQAVGFYEKMGYKRLGENTCQGLYKMQKITCYNINDHEIRENYCCVIL